MSHHCHAVRCETKVPPRLHMCLHHWRMVPKELQRILLRAYVPGQERRKDPTSDYLHAAAACVRYVARQEGLPADEVAAEVELYEAWAEMVS